MTSSLSLVPLCTVDLTIDRAKFVGAGPAGERWVAQVTGMVLAGDRIRAQLVGQAADYVTVSGGVATIDVRALVETHDGALIVVQYRGRTDATTRVGSSPAYVTPTFETGHAGYTWLNFIQAVGRSQPSDLKTARYDWYELAG